jgi:hypothetical protein
MMVHNRKFTIKKEMYANLISTESIMLTFINVKYGSATTRRHHWVENLDYKKKDFLSITQK